MSDVRVPDLNTIVIAGRLTRDPELKYISSGKAVCTIDIANSRYYKDKNGEKQEETMFIQATLWDKPAEWIGESLKKGRPVIIEGRLKSDSWEDKDSGKKRSKIFINASRVTPLDWEEKGESKPRERAETKQSDIEKPIPEDDIPF